MNKYILGLIATIILLNSKAAGQTCVSYFAAQAFTESQCNQSLQVFNNVHTPCMAILWKTFTLPENNLCTQRFLKRFEGKPHILQIHSSNEAGRRNRRLSRYEHLPGLSVNEYNKRLGRRHRRAVKAVQKNASQIKHFVKDHANVNTHLIISTGLEDNYSLEAYKTIIQTIKAVFKDVQNVQYVRNPVGDHEKYFKGADYIELHGVQPHIKSAGRCIQNLDGISINFSNTKSNSQEILLSAVSDFIKRGQALSCINILWWKEPQGLIGDFKHPRSRKFLIEQYKVNLINNLLRRF